VNFTGSGGKPYRAMQADEPCEIARFEQVILPYHGDILVALDRDGNILFGTEIDSTPIPGEDVFFWWPEIMDQIPGAWERL
jgi:hypothetical protein